MESRPQPCSSSGVSRDRLCHGVRSAGLRAPAADLSLTYHQIAYHPDGVDQWPQIIDTTMAVRDRAYPYGWLTYGHFNNHNNYDVVRTLRVGWPHGSEVERREIRKIVGEMLTWCPWTTR